MLGAPTLGHGVVPQRDGTKAPLPPQRVLRSGDPGDLSGCGQRVPAVVSAGRVSGGGRRVPECQRPHPGGKWEHRGTRLRGPRAAIFSGQAGEIGWREPAGRTPLPPSAPPCRTPSVTGTEQASPGRSSDHSELITVRQRWVVRADVRDSRACARWVLRRCGRPRGRSVRSARRHLCRWWRASVRD